MARVEHEFKHQSRVPHQNMDVPDKNDIAREEHLKFCTPEQPCDECKDNN